MTESVEPQGTAALLVDSRGRYLLHLRDANKDICDPGTWSIPGGGREAGETVAQAVARELREETGLTVPLEPFTVVGSHGTGPDGSAEDRIAVYLGAWDGDADDLPCPEGIMFRHFDASTIPFLTMCPWTKVVIDLHRARGLAPAAVPAPARPGAGRGRTSSVSTSTSNATVRSCSGCVTRTPPSPRPPTTSSPDTASRSPPSPAW